ncbi:hypothetical protein DPMN_128852 [Dreissena polymorpha]|uniref:Uncharacterized protein n=1 Tax=Dreissena polymorpha TaxID=45954 RepID=A0A9D4JW42_DREPO|nr:hypothetical protein DPMN_128852 [Dreissena polymorpha]
METTRDLYSLYFVGKLMELLVNNLLSLVIAAVTVAMLIRSSAVLVQYLDWFAPSYLKLVTSSFLPFMVMYALVLVVLLNVIFDFSMLTSIPYDPVLSLSVGEILKFTAGATHEVNVLSESQVGDGSYNHSGGHGVFCIIYTRKMFKKTGENRHP